MSHSDLEQDVDGVEKVSTAASDIPDKFDFSNSVIHNFVVSVETLFCLNMSEIWTFSLDLIKEKRAFKRLHKKDWKINEVYPRSHLK